jgi:hypothetical protein
MIDLSKKAYVWVSETFAPQAENDHPVTEQKFVKGGHQNFTSMLQRDEFPMARRSAYMTCTVKAVSYILDENMVDWKPFDRGYLVLNPKKTRETFYVVFPFPFVVLGESVVDSIIHTAFTGGLPNEKITLEITGSEGAVVTFEIARIHVD